MLSSLSHHQQVTELRPGIFDSEVRTVSRTHSVREEAGIMSEDNVGVEEMPQPEPASPTHSAREEAEIMSEDNVGVEQMPQSEPMATLAPPEGSESTATRPRLAIQRLRLENFKSYGGCIDVGPFHKSFSSIVGPNGSGKSNVIDAMLFVFGRRAKQLRHSKLSELLHHSSTYPNVQSATVTVYFHEIIDTGDGDNDYTVVSGSEFAVARTAFRNNTSKYYLNEKEVKMGKVVELLKFKGVDLDNNRFLILQGEVEQIAMMKAKAVTAHEDGLLEYLEDIIGSNRHISAIEESSKQMEALNEERGHKLNRVKSAERERDALEEAKVEAEDYLDKERELLTKKLKLNKARHHEITASFKTHNEQLSEATKKFQAFQSDVKKKEADLKELEKTFKETQKNADVAVRTMNQAKDDYSAFERKDIKLREDIKALKARDKKLQATKLRESKRTEDSEKKAEDCLREKEEAEEKVGELESDLQSAQEKFDKIRDRVRKETEPIRQRLEGKQTELLPFSEEVNKCRKDVEVNQSELKLLIDKLEAPAKNLAESEESFAQMEADFQRADETLASLGTESAELQQHLSRQKHEIGQKSNLLRNLTSSCSEMRRRVEEARSANDDVTTRSRLHSGILSAARTGVLQGVVGRLGDLASVDSKYSTAVGAAAGSNLDCIVVRTAENAQACIHFLRQQNLGRATFVILEKIGYLRSGMESWASSPRAADGPRLFDFLRILNPENCTAMYYALRDTLVAESLENARRMAFKPTRQNRVVSLQGELIESSGAMTGGGRGPTRYKLGSGSGNDAQMNQRDFQQLVQRLDATKRQVEDEESHLRELRSRSTTASSRLDELQVLIAKAKLEVNSLESRKSYMTSTTLPTLRKAVQDLELKIKKKKCPDTQRKQQLESAVKESEKLLQMALAACEGLESEISSLQEKIVASGGSSLQNAKDAVEKCRSEMSELQSVVSTASSRAAAAQKASEKAREASTSADSEIEVIKQTIVEARKQSEDMLDDAEVVLRKYQETETIHKEWMEKVAQVQTEYSEVKAGLKTVRREEVSLSEALEEVKRLVAQDKHELRSLQKNEKGMKTKLRKLSLVSVDMPGADDADAEAAQQVADEEDENRDSNSDEKESETDKMDVDSGNAEEKPATDESEEFELSVQDQKQLSMEISVLESELSKLSPNLGAIAEYQSRDVEYKSQVNELDTLTSNRDNVRKQCDSLRKARLDEFMAGFSVITLKLKELYQMITLGGDAELELVDSLDPFSEGIVFSVRPPKKSWKNISNLSGGEKTLSSLALVFALHHFKPTPLYFLDEIDAALDYKNVSIVANYVKDRTKNAQFIIISLRNNMFELADRLVGIYKTHNTTKSVTVDPGAFVMPTPKQFDVLA